MNKIIKAVRHVSYITLSKVLSLFTSRHVIVLESYADLCDSTRTLFDKMLALNLNSKYRIYWIVDNVDRAKRLINAPNVKFISQQKNFPRRFFYTTIAGICIYTHRFEGNNYNNRQQRVFVTHGAMPFKNSAGMFWNPLYNTIIIGTSEECIKYRKKVLGESKNYRITGLPRNDELFLPVSENILKLVNNKRYIVWMPTFKHHKSKTRNDFGEKCSEDVSLMTPENLEILNSSLKACDMFLVIKPHPAQNMDYFHMLSLSNIVSVTNDDLLLYNINVYHLLGNSSALVTDFSSVFIDYLLIDKPIGFELGDEANYSKGVGYVMENPFDFMPGSKIYDINDFQNFIFGVFKQIDNYSVERNVLNNRLHSYKDGHSSERVLDLLNIK